MPLGNAPFSLDEYNRRITATRIAMKAAEQFAPRVGADANMTDNVINPKQAEECLFGYTLAPLQISSLCIL